MTKKTATLPEPDMPTITLYTIIDNTKNDAEKTYL